MPSSATFATLLFFISLGFARQLSKDVIDSFDEADINGDGKLSFEELTDVEDTPDARAKFADIDADGDGFITVKDLSDAVNRGDFEWCLICCCNSLTVSDDAAFAAEQLEIEELRDEVEDLKEDKTRSMVAHQLSKDVIDSFDEADTNGDGKLSFQELTDVEDTPANRAQFADIDADGDGYITVKELSDSAKRGEFGWCLICCCGGLTGHELAAHAMEEGDAMNGMRGEIAEMKKEIELLRKAGKSKK